MKQYFKQLQFLGIRNYLLVCISILLSVTYMSSCSDDKDESNSDNLIIGTWYMGGNANFTLSFYSNGRYTATEKFDSDPEIDTWSGTYTINNELLVMTNDYYPGELEVYTIALLNSNQLILNDEYGDSIVYERSVE